MNSKIHAVFDAKGRPRVMLPNEGQMSDYKGAALILDALPKAKGLIGDRGIRCRPAPPGARRPKVNRKVPITHDAVLYRSRHKIEIMFGRLKDWRCIHTRYDRCAHTFMAAIVLATAVIF